MPVDGPCTGVSFMDVRAVKDAPDLEVPGHANDCDCRSRYREVRFLSPGRRSGWCPPPPKGLYACLVWSRPLVLPWTAVDGGARKASNLSFTIE
jgi:hypothetical protein